jgi:hypothetical protein
MRSTLQVSTPRELADARLEISGTLRLGEHSQTLTWRVPATWRDAVTAHADPFVIGLAFPMMQAGHDVEVLGPVSPSLLANLERFMDVWHLWSPTRYRRVRIWSHEEQEAPPSDEAFAIPFSAGVDSCYTALSHARDLRGRNNRRIGLGVTMFGFDIQSNQSNARPMYDALRRGAAEMLGSLGIPHVEIESDFRSLDTLWLHSHSSQLASGLALFGRGFSGAMIPNSLPVNQLGTLWGSHPLTDPMFSSNAFTIVDDGGAVPRWAKIEAIAPWPEAMRHLRVCFGVDGSIGNCGKCEKCIRTAIGFKIVDAPPAAGLPAELNLSAGKQREPWARAVRRVLSRSRREQLSKRFRRQFIPLRDRVRQLFRGTTLSKAQLAAQRANATS